MNALAPAPVPIALPPSPIVGVEARCPHCHNLYGVIAATIGTVEFKCTRPHCKSLPTGGVFSVTVVSVPQAVQVISDLVAVAFKSESKPPITNAGSMFVLTRPGVSAIIKRK